MRDQRAEFRQFVQAVSGLPGATRRTARRSHQFIERRQDVTIERSVDLLFQLPTPDERRKQANYLGSRAFHDDRPIKAPIAHAAIRARAENRAGGLPARYPSSNLG